MKLLVWIIIALILLGLVLYTRDTAETLSIVGKHSYTFIKNTYSDLKEKSDHGDYERIEDDLKEKYEKIS